MREGWGEKGDPFRGRLLPHALMLMLVLLFWLFVCSFAAVAALASLLLLLLLMPVGLSVWDINLHAWCASTRFMR